MTPEERQRVEEAWKKKHAHKNAWRRKAEEEEEEKWKKKSAEEVAKEKEEERLQIVAKYEKRKEKARERMAQLYRERKLKELDAGIPPRQNLKYFSDADREVGRRNWRYRYNKRHAEERLAKLQRVGPDGRIQRFCYVCEKVGCGDGGWLPVEEFQRQGRGYATLCRWHAEGNTLGTKEDHRRAMEEIGREMREWERQKAVEMAQRRAARAAQPEESEVIPEK